MTETPIALVRHGIAAGHDDPRYPQDADRPLTKDGVQKTRAAAAGMRTLGLAPRCIVSSPYVRARETAEILAEALGCDADTLQIDDVFTPETAAEAAWRRLLEIARTGTDATALTIQVGHQPQMGEIAAHALGCPDGDRFPLKKASCLRLLTTGAMTSLQEYLTPKTLRRLAE